MTNHSQEGGKLKGEGEVQNVRRTRCRHECEVCGEPADYRHSFLLENARRNPASAAYGRDDCSWCSDAETFVCEAHRNTQDGPDGHEWAGTFTLAKLPHMGLYWHEEVQSPTPSQEGRSSLSVEPWQPIETAPKDGTYFLASNPQSYSAWVAHWFPVAVSGYTFEQPWRSVMLNHNHIPKEARYLPPTHWMPLPNPPEQA